MKMFYLPRFARKIRAQFLQTCTLLHLIWFHRDLKMAEKKVLGHISKFNYWRRRFDQLVALGFAPNTIHRLIHEYGVNAASAGALAAIALRYTEHPHKKADKKRFSPQKIVKKLTHPTTGEHDEINKSRRLRMVLCNPVFHFDPSFRRMVDGITLSRNEHNINMFYQCLVHLLKLPDADFPPKPDMTGIDQDPDQLTWVDEVDEDE